MLEGSCIKNRTVPTCSTVPVGCRSSQSKAQLLGLTSNKITFLQVVLTSELLCLRTNLTLFLSGFTLFLSLHFLLHLVRLLLFCPFVQHLKPRGKTCGLLRGKKMKGVYHYLLEFFVHVHANSVYQMVINDHNTRDVIDIKTRQTVRHVLIQCTLNKRNQDEVLEWRLLWQLISFVLERAS